LQGRIFERNWTIFTVELWTHKSRAVLETDWA
jgi:hypothetical protein